MEIFNCKDNLILILLAATFAINRTIFHKKKANTNKSSMMLWKLWWCERKWPTVGTSL